MRWVTWLLIALVFVTATGREAWAAEPDAAELAALIDRHVETRLKADRVPAAELADDAEFIRRTYLDLHGVIPSADKVVAFLDSRKADKRAKLIDALLADPRYGEYLADVWQGYLVSPLSDDRRVRADRFRKWLADRFNTKTWDRISTDLLTATGKLEENPAVIYLIEGRHPRTVPDLADLTSRYFLGVRLSCAQCHDHPFVEAWKQQDFWGMAAFFTQVQTPGKPKLVYRVGVKDYPEQTLDSLKVEGVPDGFLSRPPTFLGGSRPPRDKQTSRAALAAWLTSPKNPYFARAMANRTWWRLFGRGLVNPVDDMHSGNAPSHPELLDLLARRFAESGFDHKFLTRAIVSSRAYQRTSRTGTSDKQAALFGRASLKPLSAGQLYDSHVAVLGPPARKRGGPLTDARAEFIDFFSDEGDPDPTAYRRGIPHLLRQMNSDQFGGRHLAALASRLAKPRREADDVASDLFLTILSRRPTADEKKLFRAYVERAGSLETAARELAWALLLTSEFSLNH